MWQKIKNIYHLGQSVAGKAFYRVLTEGITFIGVTGTDGKTTTSTLIHHILQEAGHKTALISTISAEIGGKTLDTGFHVTTPSPFALQAYVKKAKKAGAKYIVLEVTSHALDQYRVFGIPFTVGVLTNITHEHLDYHKTYENYVKAKVKLLVNSKTSIVNLDDGSYPSVKKLLEKRHYNGKIITYGLGPSAEVNPDTFPFKTKLIGEFNTYNVLAAIAATQSIGLDPTIIKKAVASFTPPVGRTEIVHEDGFTIMIDFAHTPNSISQILKTIKHEMTPKRIIHIFGSAGERDREKRIAMGEASASFADVIILTAEDPRSESVEEINHMIQKGITKVQEEMKREPEVYEIPDRRQAIREAIRMAKKGDIVILTGKGHERSLNLGQGEMPWSEHEAVAEALQLRNVK